MKKLGLVLLALILTNAAFAQVDVPGLRVFNKELLSSVDDLRETSVRIDEIGFFNPKDHDNLMNIKPRNIGINIIDDGYENSINVISYGDEMFNDDSIRKRKYYHFRGHWSGFEIGINGFMNNDFSMTLPAGAEYMELNTGRSWNVNFNFLQYPFRLIADKVGLVTGLGLELNNYHFDNDNNIRENAAGNIEELPYLVNLEKSKLSTAYITLPIILELNSSGRRNCLHFGGGVIGGVKIGSYTKVVYRDTDNKQKDKVKDDFNLSPLRYGFTARIGYRKINVFANYYITPLFENNKGPELYPFSIGLVLCNL